MDWLIRYSVCFASIAAVDFVRKRLFSGKKSLPVGADALILGVELGGTTCKAAVAKVSDPTKVLEMIEIPSTTPDETMGQIREWAMERKDRIATIGIASFGPIQLDKRKKGYGRISRTTPKVAFRDADIVGYFKSFRVPIHFETDVNAPAFAEMKYGGHENADSCVYITVGTGVGVGATVNGLPVHGLMHPEGGHYSVKRKNGDTYKGWSEVHPHGIENLISSRAIAERSGVSAAELADLPDNHEVWKTVAYYLGEMCATITYMLSPHVIVLGGGVLKRAILLDLTREYTKQIVNGYIDDPLLKEDIDKYVTTSVHGADSGLIGSLALGELALDGASLAVPEPVKDTA